MKDLTKKLGIYNNPVIGFGILTIISGLFVYIFTGFTIPDIYIDRNYLNQIWYLYYYVGNTFNLVEAGCYNPDYNLQTMLFMLFGWCVSFLIFTIWMKITEWQGFKKLPAVKNKLLIYCWINLVTVIIVFAKLGVLGTYIAGYITSPFDKSMGLAFFFCATLTLIFLIIYILVANLLCFLIYNKGVKHWLIEYLLYFGLVFLFFETALSQFYFSWLNILFNLYCIIWVYFLSYSIDVTKGKAIR